MLSTNPMLNVADRGLLHMHWQCHHHDDCQRVIRIFWGTLLRRCELVSWLPASFHWSPCQSPPWSVWWSLQACVCTSAPCGSSLSGNWCHNPTKHTCNNVRTSLIM